MKYLRRLCLGLHVLFVLLLYSVFLNAHIAPSQWLLPSYVAVGFLYLLLGHLIVVLFWFAWRWKYGFVLLFISLGLYVPLEGWVSFNSKSEIRPVGLKVLTYNVHYLEDVEGINNLIEKESPDVLLLQEIYEKDIQKVSFTRPKNRYTAQYPYVVISSKYPILKQGEILDRSTNGHIAFADIQTPRQTIRFISAYLEPMYLDPNSLDRAFSSEHFQEGNKYVWKQLQHGFRIHHKQLNQLEPFIRTSPYPVILGGDLNAVPYSYEHQFLEKYLVDGFGWSNKVFAPTFFVKGFPLRLDYFFFDPSLAVSRQRTLPIAASDHYPVLLELQ